MAQQRARTRINTEFRSGDLKASGKVRNVSEGGLFVRTRSIPDEGEPVELQFTVPGHAPIAVTGMVWWTTREVEQTVDSGFGLRLLEENESYQQWVSTLF